MKNGLFLLAAIAVALAAGILVMRGGEHVSSAPPVPPDADIAARALGRAPLVVECSLLAEGATPDENVRLVTNNFGGDVVNVQGAFIMCEGAKKQRLDNTAAAPFGAPGRFVYECYRLLNGANPDDPFTLRTANFGDDRVVVGQAVVMCEGAQKVHTTATGLVTTTGTAGHDAWECYLIASNQTHEVPVALTTANFGTDRGLVLRPILMCEDAQKHSADPAQPDVGHPSGLVWECFLLRSDVQRAEPVSLTTQNFGKDDVIVENPLLMCERARKIPTLTFVPVTPVPTATGTPTPATFPTATDTPAGGTAPTDTPTPTGG